MVGFIVTIIAHMSSHIACVHYFVDVAWSWVWLSGAVQMGSADIT